MKDETQTLNNLTNLLKDFEAFETLNQYTSHFNLFTTLGLTNNELKHSNMLAFLLNPNEKHGLDDQLIIQFTHHYVNNTPVNKDALQLLLKDFNDGYVLREYRNIDLLFISESTKTIIAIENKIWSAESRYQLNKYKKILISEFNPNEYQHLYFFLTPYGHEASKEEWIPLSYSHIIDFLEKSIQFKQTKINVFMSEFINQYIELLRRYIVEDTQLEKICREIYSKHRDALDLIFEYRPDSYSEVSDALQEFIRNRDDLFLDGSGKKYIRFIPKSLNTEAIKHGNGKWTSSKNIILFELDNSNNKLSTSLVLGPGDEDFRQAIYQFAINSTVFSPRKTLSNEYSKLIGLKTIVKDYNKVAPEELPKVCTLALEKYLNNDFKEVVAALTQFLKEYKV